MHIELNRVSIYHPMQVPVMTAHGVGFNTPSVPLSTAARTSFTGAIDVRYTRQSVENESTKMIPYFINKTTHP
jgi:hypothetical protein